MQRNLALKWMAACALVAISIVGAKPAHAAEQSLNTILDNLYGLPNVTFINKETYFTNPQSMLSAEAVFAGNEHHTDFGWYGDPLPLTTLANGKLSNPNAGLTLNAVWHSVADTNGDGYVDPGDADFAARTNLVFNPVKQPFGLYIQPNPAANPSQQTGTFYTQSIRNNRTANDLANGYIPSTSTIVNGNVLVAAGVKTNVHALVFRVTKTRDKTNVGGKWVFGNTFTDLAKETIVVAWEDEGSAGSFSTTSDYNDLVVQLNVVPEPMYFQLGGLLVGGLITLKLRKARRQA